MTDYAADVSFESGLLFQYPHKRLRSGGERPSFSLNKRKAAGDIEPRQPYGEKSPQLQFLANRQFRDKRHPAPCQYRLLEGFAA
jgi:hypothetical protein